tara:strand:+ start:849 stop:1061 length:213 start_codon:yes stop_codon:yes gene_type:complete
MKIPKNIGQINRDQRVDCLTRQYEPCGRKFNVTIHLKEGWFTEDGEDTIQAPTAALAAKGLKTCKMSVIR